MRTKKLCAEGFQRGCSQTASLHSFPSLIHSLIRSQAQPLTDSSPPRPRPPLCALVSNQALSATLLGCKLCMALQSLFIVHSNCSRMPATNLQPRPCSILQVGVSVSVRALLFWGKTRSACLLFNVDSPLPKSPHTDTHTLSLSHTHAHTRSHTHTQRSAHASRSKTPLSVSVSTMTSKWRSHTLATTTSQMPSMQLQPLLSPLPTHTNGRLCRVGKVEPPC